MKLLIGHGKLEVERTRCKPKSSPTLNGQLAAVLWMRCFLLPSGPAPDAAAGSRQVQCSSGTWSKAAEERHWWEAWNLDGSRTSVSTGLNWAQVWSQADHITLKFYDNIESPTLALSL